MTDSYAKARKAAANALADALPLEGWGKSHGLHDVLVDGDCDVRIVLDAALSAFETRGYVVCDAKLLKHVTKIKRLWDQGDHWGDNVGDWEPLYAEIEAAEKLVKERQSK